MILYDIRKYAFQYDKCKKLGCILYAKFGKSITFKSQQRLFVALNHFKTYIDGLFFQNIDNLMMLTGTSGNTLQKYNYYF